MRRARGRSPARPSLPRTPPPARAQPAGSAPAFLRLAVLRTTPRPLLMEMALGLGRDQVCEGHVYEGRLVREA